jgi:N-acetylneuraminic acid mutarotase
MKTKLFTLLALAFCLDGNGQTLNFQNMANMNIQRGAIAYANDSNYIYVSNGFSTADQYTTQIERYDITGNTWSIFTNSLVSKRFASSAVVGNNLYLFNGYDTLGVYNNKMEVVNLTTGTVTFSTNNPLPTYYSGVAVWDSVIYTFGGSTSSTSCTNALYSFDTRTQVWTQLASMTQSKQTGGAIINGKLYALGGFDGSNDVGRIDMYDISTNTWSYLGHMSDSVSSYASAVLGSKIYLSGSYSNLYHLACYDVVTNTYTILSETNMIGRRNSGAAVINGNLYIFGGNQTNYISSSLSSLQVSNLTLAGIEQYYTNNNISIYPNPNNGSFVVELNPSLTLPQGKGTLMQVYDVTGKLVLTQTINGKTTIDATNLNEGVYNISITSNEGVINKRIVLVK